MPYNNNKVGITEKAILTMIKYRYAYVLGAKICYFSVF
jgi:hypothetical protein